MQVLLVYGANIDAKNDLRGMTPLHIAATRDSLEFCAMLIVRGADASIEDNTGRIAAEYCQQGTQLERLLKLPQGSVEANEFAHFCLQPHTEEEYEEVAAAEEEKEEKAVLELKGQSTNKCACASDSSHAHRAYGVGCPGDALTLADKALAIDPTHVKSKRRQQGAAQQLKEESERDVD